jgi:galactosylceramidase
MAGLIVGGGKTFSMPYFDNFIVKSLHKSIPNPSLPAPGQLPIYRLTDPIRQSTRLRARKG